MPPSQWIGSQRTRRPPDWDNRTEKDWCGGEQHSCLTEQQDEELFCEFNFQWSFFGLFLSYSCFWQTQEKRQVFNMRIPLSWAEDFLVMLLAFFLRWCLRTKSVLKFRFSNDVSGLFTYSIKSFQFVFITVSLSDEKVEWIFFSESKGEAVYYIFYKMHFLKKPFQSWKWKCSGGKKKAYTRQETEVL